MIMMTFLGRTTVAISQVSRAAAVQSRLLSQTSVRLTDDCGRSKQQDKSKILKEKTPIGKLESQEGGAKHPYQEKEPLPEHPGGVNPTTGEVGGPRGPEPTRYGDWERKGRVTDF